MRTWLKALGAVLLVLALATSCSDDSTSDNSTRDDEGNITEGGDVGVFALEVGDCFDQPPDGNIQEVAGVPCEEPHDLEVYAIFDMEGGDDAPFPGSEAVEAAAEECQATLFEDYVGVDFASSRFGVLPLTPTQDSWEQGDDREIICTAATVDGTQVTGSIQGTAE